MSFLTEYFDEYRPHPLCKAKLCRPENRFAKLEGNWLEPGVEGQRTDLSDEEVQAFIKSTMKALRGQSTYYNDYCAHLSSAFKTRKFKPRPKKLRPCYPSQEIKVEAEAQTEVPKSLALIDTEVMKNARTLYADKDTPIMKPLPTHLRILGYARPLLYRTGLSEYSGGIGRLAFEMVRDNRTPQYLTHNGGRAKWGLPPEGTRQPELDVAPYDGERLH